MKKSKPKNLKPEDLGLKIIDKNYINKNGTLKKRWIEREMDDDLIIRYSYRIFINEYSKTKNEDHQLYVGFIREFKTIASITSHISGDTGKIIGISYSHENLILNREKFLQKIEYESKIFEWCLWNI
jgi:hypothetical protein